MYCGRYIDQGFGKDHILAVLKHLAMRLTLGAVKEPKMKVLNCTERCGSRHASDFEGWQGTQHMLEHVKQ